MDRQQIKFIPFYLRIIELLMKMKEGSCCKSKQQKSKPKVELTQHYLKQILRNIENIQSTILKKLDQTSERQNILVKPFTPKKQSYISKSCSNKKEKQLYHGQRCQTPRGEAKTSRNIRQSHHVNPFLTISSSEVTNEVLKQLNRTPKMHQSKIFTNFAQSIKGNQYKSSKINQRQQFFKVMEKIEDKENNIADHPRSHRVCPKTPNSRLQRKKYDIQLVVNSPQSISTPQNDIQSFYKKQIERLDIQEKIRQLEEELEGCLYNKRASKPAQFTYIRSKMKRISLQLNQLKEEKLALMQS